MNSRPTLDFALIRTRVAQLALPEATLADMLGFYLADLEERLDSHTVSLHLLARLATVLQVDIADLIISEAGPAQLLEPSRDDAAVLLAALASYGAMHPGQLTHLLGWTADRLDVAANQVHQQLEPTALRLVVTDLRLTLIVRPDALSGLTRQHLDRARLLHRPLSYVDAGQVLNLVKKKLLEPFPDQSESEDADNPNPTWLVDIGVAVPLAEPSIPGKAARIQIHPDIMFALRLTDSPAPEPPAARTEQTS